MPTSSRTLAFRACLPAAFSASIAVDAVFNCGAQVDILLARGGATKDTNFVQKFFRLQLVSLLEVPQPIILPRSHVVWIGDQRLVVPEFREIVVAQFAIGVAEVVCYFWTVVVTKRA